MNSNFFNSLSFILISLLVLTSNAKQMTLDEVLAANANPLSLQASLQKNSSTKLITNAAGGQISLKGLDGSEYTLTFPAKSVSYDINITMTETKDLKVNGTAFQSFGVQLHPDGLELVQHAILEIKTKRALNTKKLSLITSQNDGKVAHVPYLKSFSTQSVKFALFHFSNYAATDEERVQEIIDLGMADTESVRINNWFNRQILGFRRQALNDGADNEELAKFYRNSLKEAVDKVVIPKLKSAKTCEGGNEALRSYFIVSRQAGLFSMTIDEILGADGVAAFRDARAITTSLCLQEARQYCNVEHNIPPALKIWLTLSRFAGLLGDEELLETVNDTAEKCMKFKFFMQTDFKLGEGQEFNGLIGVSEYDFGFTIAGTIISAAGFLKDNGVTEPVHDFQEGEITITETYFNVEDFTCSRISMTATPGPIGVDNFVGDMLANRKPVLRITGPNPSVNARFRCSDNETPPNVFEMDLPPVGSEKYFLGLFHATHGETGLDEMDKEGHFVLKKAVFQNKAKFVEAVYNHVVEDVVREVTTVIVTHTPEE